MPPAAPSRVPWWRACRAWAVPTLLAISSTVAIVRRSDTSVVALPLAALYQQGAEPAVWVYSGPAEGEGKVELRPVKVAAYIEKAVLVGAGLKEGERVVTAGVHKLIPGQTVRLLPEAQTAGAKS